MIKILSIIIALAMNVLPFTAVISSGSVNSLSEKKQNTNQGNSSMSEIISKEKEYWTIGQDESEGDWCNAYYDEEKNTFYSYGDDHLARYGIAGQVYTGDQTIWMLRKHSLYMDIQMLCTNLYLAGYQNTKVVVAYVTGGKRDRFEDYIIPEVGNYSSTPEGPVVLYSITVDSSNDIIIEDQNMKVFDYFFGETFVVNYKRAEPYR